MMQQEQYFFVNYIVTNTTPIKCCHDIRRDRGRSTKTDVGESSEKGLEGMGYIQKELALDRSA
jgi:hypothetical protein